MGVGHRALGVARVAHPGDDLSGGHRAAGRDARREAPRPVVAAVVAAGHVVVDVVHVVLPPVGVLDDDAVAGCRVVEQTVDDAVAHGQQRLQPVADQVVALVLSAATVPARAEVVAVADRAGDGERDRSHPPHLGDAGGHHRTAGPGVGASDDRCRLDVLRHGPRGRSPWRWRRRWRWWRRRGRGRRDCRRRRLRRHGGRRGDRGRGGGRRRLRRHRRRGGRGGRRRGRRRGGGRRRRRGRRLGRRGLGGRDHRRRLRRRGRRRLGRSGRRGRLHGRRGGVRRRFVDHRVPRQQRQQRGDGTDGWQARDHGTSRGTSIDTARTAGASASASVARTRSTGRGPAVRR